MMGTKERQFAPLIHVSLEELNASRLNLRNSIEKHACYLNRAIESDAYSATIPWKHLEGKDYRIFLSHKEEVQEEAERVGTRSMTHEAA